ncbi:hypothetical protein ROZALSC1DRAFT_29739 [Rozella allomycis CSF55]|uniref:Uncharacterized protein n=1 Tax=Rozella allomycis (strain CSF55) TaxID=988480 RepID=A0A075AP42_ROZAC|nr:hypothetical protein O9G_000260 [Rozella allomycis CSF55]RKP18582.1 hypothetical protein ROZALSC1DRAFT_29739 [Rozella allomycis CSF55]|eukprot:EPZ31781.1 hypothetical protein O9G_000260 [Rozella allomycis CSF55]
MHIPSEVRKYFERCRFDLTPRSQLRKEKRDPMAIETELERVRKYFNIDRIEYVSNVPDDESLLDFDYEELREQQNKLYAKDLVKEGNVEFNNGNMEHAVELYISALEMDAACVEAYIARGNALVKQGLYTQAIKDYENALKIDPGNPEAEQSLQVLNDEKDALTSLVEDSKMAVNNKTKETDTETAPVTKLGAEKYKIKAKEAPAQYGSNDYELELGFNRSNKRKAK